MSCPSCLRARVSALLLVLAWMLVVCPARAQNTAAPEQNRRQHPVVTEVPSAQVPEKFRNQPKPLTPDPPSLRYASLRDHEPPRIVLPTLDPTPYIEEDKQAAKKGERKVRGGVMRPGNITPEKDGEWSEPEPGVRVWRVEVQSPGAKAIKLRLESVKLAEKSSIFIYAPGHSPEVYGSDNTTAGGLFSGLLPSDTVRLELVQAPNPDGRYPDDHFIIAGVGHAYRGQGEVADIVQPGTCELDAACYPDWLQSGNSVGLINYAQGDYIYYCSGAMINNNTGDYSPLFLTAAHCGIDTNVAPSVSVEWLYASSSCGVPPYSESGSTGSTFLATSAESDSTLLKLGSLNIPNAVTWSGWSIDPQSGAITAIHHPEASYRRISFGNLIADDPTNPDFHRVVFSQGVTEPGSSGSPLFNANHQIIGQLYGGNSTCANPQGVDIYGKLANSYPHFVDAAGHNYLVSGLGDDHFGDISSRDKAPSIPPGTPQNNLVLRYGHDDWFNVGIVQKGLTIAIGFPMGSGGVFGIELYRNQEATPISSNLTGYLSTLIPSTDNYYLRFFLNNTVVRQEYGIVYSFSQPPPPFVQAVTVSNPRSLSDYKYEGGLGASGGAGTYWFEYAQGSDLTNMKTSPVQPFPSYFNGIVSYTPPEAFQEDTDYTFRFAANDGFQTVKSNPVTFHTISGVLVLNPTSVAFPATAIGSESQQTVTITNADTSHNLYFTSPLTWSGNPIAATSDCPNPLGAGASCHFTLIFHPTSAISLAGAFYETGFTTSGGGAAIPLSGVGLQTVLNFIGFPATWHVLVGRRATVMLTLVNVGNEALDTRSPQLSGPFSQTNDCPASLAPQLSCHIYLTASPVTLAGSSGTLVMAPYTSAFSFKVDAYDIALNFPRDSRPSRSGAIVGHAMARVTAAPSAPINAKATISCAGFPGVSCSVQQPVVDLSHGPQDVDIAVTVDKENSREGTSSTTRSMRLHGIRRSNEAAVSHQPRNGIVRVTATIEGLTRTLDIPVTVSQ